MSAMASTGASAGAGAGATSTFTGAGAGAGTGAGAGVGASLNPVEAARAAAALDAALEKLSFLSAVTPDVMAHQDEVKGLVGEELARIMANQRALEARHDWLIEQRAQLKGLANKQRLREVLEEIGQVSYALRESVKTLCRSLKDNPDLGDSLARIAEERASLIALIERAAADLREGGHFRGLATFVQREQEQRERLLAVSAREEVITKEVEALAATLKEEEERHAQEGDRKRAEISLLKEQLRRMKLDTSLTLRYARKEINAKNEATGRLNVTDEAALAAEIARLRRMAEVEAVVHEESIAVLKREQEAAARTAEEWKAKHATDLAATQAELKAQTEVRDAQRAELAAMQDRYEFDLQATVDKKAAADLETERILEAGADAMRKKISATQLQKVLGEMFLTVQGFMAQAAEAKKKAKAKK